MALPKKYTEIQEGHPDFDIPEEVRRRYETSQCQHQQGGEVCRRKHYSKGLCQAHYYRKWRYGDCGSVEIGPAPPRKLKCWMVVMAKKKIDAGEWCLQDAANYFDLSKSSMSEAVRGVTFKALTAVIE